MMDPQATMDVMHRLMIQREAALWFTSGRAIHAWRLRKIFRKAKWPVPEEIEIYLDACTDRLCSADLTKPKQVADAFDLGPKGRKASVTSDRLAAAESVFGILSGNTDRRRRGKEEWTLEQAIDQTAKELSANRPGTAKDRGSFIRAAYYEWLEHIQNVEGLNKSQLK